MKRSIELPLPPSVNDLYKTRYGQRGIYTNEVYKKYLKDYVPAVGVYLKKIKHKPFDTYFYLDMDWFLPRKNADSHNYIKGLFDMLQMAGFMVNDLYVMNRTQSITIKPKDPKVLITWSV